MAMATAPSAVGMALGMAISSRSIKGMMGCPVAALRSFRKGETTPVRIGASSSNKRHDTFRQAYCFFYSGSMNQPGAIRTRYRQH